VWSLGLCGDALYVGAKPGKLYRSTDRGATFGGVAGINAHPDRGGWQPGAAGLVLHSSVATPDDPAKLWVGRSAAGVFATEDGGATWERRNQLSNADAAHAHRGARAGHDRPDTGPCVHNLVRAPGGADLLYQQNHHGVFRSGDGGRSWQTISNGLPSTFGFPVAVDPVDPTTLWVLPLNCDTLGRYPPGASAAGWRSRDSGATGAACRSGIASLPSFDRRWRLIGQRRRGCISPPTPGRCSPVAMAAIIGTKLRGICRPCFRSRR